MAAAAHGVVVYDAITTNNWHSSFFVEDEFADDTTLSTGAGTLIRQVEVGVLRNGGFPGTYNGTMTVRLWADAGGVPGAFLGSATAPVSLSDNVPHIIAAQFAGVTATTGTIWTGVLFSFTTQLGAGIVQGTTVPSVGSSTNLMARHYPDSSWGVTAGPNFTNWIRIDTVPAPGGALVLGAGAALLGRRRR
jgi:hypothetical protein